MDTSDIDQKNRVKNSVLRFLSFRPRSIYEVKVYLLKRGYASGLITQVVDDLAEAGFLDDKLFASWLTDSRIRTGPAGPIKITAELKAKGIAADIIKDVISRDWTKIIRAGWTKNAKKLALLSPRDKMQKIRNILIRQGFSHQQIGRLVDSLRLSGYNTT